MIHTGIEVQKIVDYLKHALPNILINKMAKIQRCLKRIKEEFNPEEPNGEKSKSEDEFRLNCTKQDSVVLNL
jgi:hypothetical protein